MAGHTVETDIEPHAPSDNHAPSDKERKYDRQLRLWAASGQAALERANILLVNSGTGTVGIETLKNLVLPGIGSFTIADEAEVGENDLGINFFLDESCRGKSRAQCCMELLLELNPEVTGNFYPKSDSHLDLKNVLDSSDIFTVILYSLPLSSEHLGIIQTYAKEHQTPLVATHSVGFYSYFRIILPDVFPVVETHPEATSSTDLRLLSPWPELVTFSRNMTEHIDSLNDFDHGHLPLIVILLHYLSIWKNDHDNTYPTTYSDKVAFRGLITSAMRTNNAEGGEENFEEAISAVMKLIKPDTIPPTLQQVFECCEDKDYLKSNFWIISKAVKDFFSKHQQLPLPGNLPDMKTQSAVYIQLQSLYREKARRDISEVLSTVRLMTGGSEVTAPEVELFCKNARFIKLINAGESERPSLDQVIENELTRDNLMESAESEASDSLILVYLALTAIEQDATVTEENIISSIVQRAPALAGNKSVARVAKEVSRAAGGELHNISALTGGFIAQEVIKVITKQYVPIENTCIFDGIKSRCQVIRL